MNTALKYRDNENEFFSKSKLSLLDDNELKSINGGTDPITPLVGWKAIALLVGGTAGAIIVGVAATILVYKGVKYLISD